MKTWRLLNYFDVWADEDEGWVVNDYCVEFRDLVITDDATDQDLLDYLKGIEFLTTNDPELVGIDDHGEVIEIYQVSDGMPIAALMLNE